MARPDGSVIVRLPSANAATIGGRGAGATNIGWPVLIAMRIARASSFQNLRDRRVGGPPLLMIALISASVRGIIVDDAAPGPDRAAEAASQLAALAELPLRLRDLGVLRLMQHLPRDNLVRLELLVAGALEGRVGIEFPLLAG